MRTVKVMKMWVTRRAQTYPNRLKLKLYNANVKCKIADLESLENPFIIPFLFNCQSEHLISAAVPIGIQQNATFILIISTLPNRSGLYADENGVWKMTGCRPKYYSIVKDENGRVVEMERVHDHAILMLVSEEDHSRFPRISGITRPSCPSNLERKWTSGSHLYFSTTRMTTNLPSSKRAQSSRLHKRHSNMD